MVDGVIPNIFYLHLHSKLVNKSNGDLMSKKEATSYLCCWKIPKQIRPLIIKELEMLNLISIKDCRTIKLRKSTFDVDNLNSYYRRMGLFSPRN